MRMTPHPANDGDPSWSHDGRWIYFDSARTGEQQVWKMPADGGEAIQLTWDGGEAPLESPDGKFLYYTTRNTTLWRVPQGGGQATKVLEGLSSDLNLAIVDKGIYFVPDSGSSIQFLDLRTNQIRRIASLERPVGAGVLGDDGGLAISPDGRWILYTQTDQGGAELSRGELPLKAAVLRLTPALLGTYSPDVGTSNAPCCQPGGLALFLSRSLFFFCESFHALLKRRAVHILRIHNIPGSQMAGFMPHRVERFCFRCVPIRI